jgi:ferredoxin-NADP reductase
VRHYSLCGDPEDRIGYLVAVLDQPGGRGGSREFHDRVAAGTELVVREPRNHFPLVDASSYLFIAGGIGITPILPMVRQLAKSGSGFRVVYGGRSASSMAFCDDIRAYEGSVSLVPEDTSGRIDIAGEIDRCPAGVQVFCCGPAPLLRAVEEVCTGHRRVGGLHFERFGSAGGAVSTAGLGTFEVELARTGITMSVDEESSILDKVLQAVPDQPWSCREGYCGTCETAILSGEPEHADDILTPAERASNSIMMICVGRSRSPRLVLDI